MNKVSIAETAEMKGLFEQGNSVAVPPELGLIVLGELELLKAARDALRTEVERLKRSELVHKTAADKLLSGLMEMRTFLWDRDTRLMAQDGSCRDSREGCEQALTHLWDIIDPLTDGKDKTAT